MFFDKIKPDMKKIATYSCQAAQDIIEARKNSHELFGFDFMVDENFNTWLIEINSSPAMDYSTPITERLVKSVLPDLVKVVLDYNYAPMRRKKKVDTGMFTLIHRGKKAKTNSGIIG